MGGAASLVGTPIAMLAGAAACAAVVVGVLAARPDLRARDKASIPTPDPSVKRQRPALLGPPARGRVPSGSDSTMVTIMEDSRGVR